MPELPTNDRSPTDALAQAHPAPTHLVRGELGVVGEEAAVAACMSFGMP
jgi:hypothetical protein